MRATNEIQFLYIQAVANANLPKNASKGDWKADSVKRLFWLLLVEIWELLCALVVWCWYEERYQRCIRMGWNYSERLLRTRVRRARGRVTEEAADCVCFLAFIVDKVQSYGSN